MANSNGLFSTYGDAAFDGMSDSDENGIRRKPSLDNSDFFEYTDSSTSEEEYNDHDEACSSREGTTASPNDDLSSSCKYSQWKDVTEGDKAGPVHHLEFEKYVACLKEVPPDCSEPVDFFKLIFSEKVVKMIIQESCKNAENEAVGDASIWKDPSVEEFYIFLGLLLNMGSVPFPSFEYFWTDPDNHAADFFSKIMARSRFEMILHTVLRCCQIDENVRVKEEGIQPVIDELVCTFQKFFFPFQPLVVDESWIGYRRQLAFKQLFRRRTNKWGLRARTLSDSTSGYVLNVNMTYGKEDQGSASDVHTDPSEVEVMELVKPYLNKGHHVFCDVRFSSLELADHLHDHGTYLTGTINIRLAGVPRHIKSYRKENKSLRCGKLLLQTNRKKRTESILSTYYGGDEIAPNKVEGSRRRVQKSLARDRYDVVFGKVEILDEHMAVYGFARKAVPWWEKLFLWLIEICVFNSFVLYKFSDIGNEERKVSPREFRDKLVISLATVYKNSPVEFSLWNGKYREM